MKIIIRYLQWGNVRVVARCVACVDSAWDLDYFRWQANLFVGQHEGRSFEDYKRGEEREDTARIRKTEDKRSPYHTDLRYLAAILGNPYEIIGSDLSPIVMGWDSYLLESPLRLGGFRNANAIYKSAY